MSLKSIWDSIPQAVKTSVVGLLVGTGGTFGVGEVMKRPEVTIPISAGRQQLIEAGHVDSDKLRERLNRAIDEEFKAAGICKDPVIAEKEVAKTAKLARCETPVATPNN